jgi:nucleoside-diphosphate-sugar epimerase
MAGMVGPGLRKNAVYDILHGHPLRVHPESQFQFMHTDSVAAAAWSLVRQSVSGEVFNICGEGLISPREVAALSGLGLDCSALDGSERPRVVHVSTEKISRLTRMPSTRETVEAFLRGWGSRELQAINSP